MATDMNWSRNVRVLALFCCFVFVVVVVAFVFDPVFVPFSELSPPEETCSFSVTCPTRVPLFSDRSRFLPCM